MKRDGLLKVLTEFAAERIALLNRHEAGARVVGQYDFNNAYQYIISREETHLTWLRNALGEVGAPLPGPAAALPLPQVGSSKKGRDGGGDAAVLSDDARQLRAFVEKWRPRLDDVTHARHRTMLNVILGESLEHAHLFEQAAGGFLDLLGRRTGGVARVGEVMPTRWVE